MQVIIGVDPHKASHTAVAIGDDEQELGRTRVRATRAQTEQLLTWAESFDRRVWAIEGADGLGFLLAQQLISAGETVVDVPATLAARDAAAEFQPVPQERPQRRHLGGHHSTATGIAATGASGR